MAGVAVAIALAAIYAQQVIGFTEAEIMVLIFVLNIAAVVGALLAGYGQDAIGHRLALALTLLGWMATCAIAASVTTKGGFWVAGVIAGLCMGPVSRWAAPWWACWHLPNGWASSTDCGRWPLAWRAF